MVERHPPIAGIGMDAYEPVARASGQKPKDERWTVLTIYRRRATAPADYPVFLAEVVGETLHPREERRVRDAPFDTLAKALSWGAFNAKSALYDELRRKAIAWMEADQPLVPVALHSLQPGTVIVTGGQPTRAARTAIADEAIRLLRELIEAAKHALDEDRLDRAIDAAEAFLKEVDDGPARNR